MGYELPKVEIFQLRTDIILKAGVERGGLLLRIFPGYNYLQFTLICESGMDG